MHLNNNLWVNTGRQLLGGPALTGLTQVPAEGGAAQGTAIGGRPQLWLVASFVTHLFGSENSRHLIYYSFINYISLSATHPHLAIRIT